MDRYPGRFIVACLPRCGSTNFAQMLSLTAATRCLHEPFHPSNYGGTYSRFVRNQYSLEFATELIWQLSPGIKHVWKPDGWPFAENPEFNRQLLLGSDRRIIVLTRRNLLKRSVSQFLCQRTNYWVGTRDEFLRRVTSADLSGLNIEVLRQEVHIDKSAVSELINSLGRNGRDYLVVGYEDLYRHDATTEDRVSVINSILHFLGQGPIDIETFAKKWLRHFDSDINRWVTFDVYQLIPGIREINDQLGSREYGCLW